MIDRRWYSDVKKTRLSSDGTAEEVRTKGVQRWGQEEGWESGMAKVPELRIRKVEKGWPWEILRTPH